MNLFARLMKAAAPPLSEVEAAHAALVAREKEIDERIAAIQPESHVVSAGPERRRLEIEGEPEDLVVLDQELALLRAERAALPAKRQALAERRVVAEADEAARKLPSQVKALPAILARWQEAAQAATKAKAELHRAMTTIGQQRRALDAAGREAPGVRAEVAAQIADALGLERPDAPGHYSRARAELFQRLGAEQVEMQQSERAAQARAKRDGFAAEANDDIDYARHPEQSIWARKAL